MGYGLILPALYTLSVLIGLVVCGALVWAKRERGAWIAAAIFFGGPFGLNLYLSLKADWDLDQFHKDVAYVKELCAKHGGDKIYRTVDNVEGVFQMKALNPSQDFQWSDQYGMAEPWALAFEAYPDNGWLGVKGKGYWFIEQQPRFGSPPGPPFRRSLLVATPVIAPINMPDAVTSDKGIALKRGDIQVQTLKSRYGYTTEDLTTPELRKRWIGGGKLKIIDLQTKEVLAERTGYYRATGPQVRMAWAPGIPCPPGPSRLVDAPTVGFILAVLRPPSVHPTSYQLNSFKE